MSAGSPEAGRWQAVEELFHAALELPTAERPAFLDEAAGGDEALRAETASLLSALESPEAFSERAARELTRQMIGGGPPDGESPHPAPFPERLGPYRLVEVLGEGGMGTVYLAEQSEPLPRRVALKLMHWGDARGRALKRFELEREALARMSHPTIAQVFGAGATEHGQPYVALEYVPGPPITEYCDARRLDLRQRLRLLMAVCDGVRHAHEKAVIHRDLKPSNILVTEVQGDPLPKIIDFGIAKCLEPWSDSAAQMTATRWRVGSPGYVSPEALTCGSRAVDTRSDVYSLGVVLGQLVIGVHPFGTSLDCPEAARAPWSDPPRPSQRFRALPPEQRREIARLRRISESQLLRQLRGELDWIVLRAIAPEPAARYGSVAELASDLDRWLTGRPVAAKPPSFTYQAVKALRRHRVVSTASALVLATVAVFSIRSNLLFHRAEASRLQAEELVSFMLDDLSAQLTPMGRLDLLESVARHALGYFESGDGRLAQGGRRPAAALRQIGRVLADRGDLAAAIEAYERARSLDQWRWQASPADPAARLDLVSDLELLAMARDDLGEQLVADTLLEEAEGHLRVLVAEYPDHLPARIALAKALGTVIAPRQRELGHTARAVKLSEEAVLMLQDLRLARPDDVEMSRVLGLTRYSLGLLELFGQKDPAAAIPHFEAGTAVFESLAERQPEASTWRYRLAVLKGQGLASSYRDLGRLSEAQAANREALGLFEVLVREEPTNTRWAHALGWELIRQGGLALQTDDLDLAESAFRRSVGVQVGLVAQATGPHSAWLDGLASAYEGVADVAERRGAPAVALAAAENALGSRQKTAGEVVEPRFHELKRVVTTVRIGELHRQLGDDVSAREAATRTLSLLATLDEAEIEDASVLHLYRDARRRAAELLR